MLLLASEWTSYSFHLFLCFYWTCRYVWHYYLHVILIGCNLRQLCCLHIEDLSPAVVFFLFKVTTFRIIDYLFIYFVACVKKMTTFKTCISKTERQICSFKPALFVSQVAGKAITPGAITNACYCSAVHTTWVCSVTVSHCLFLLTKLNLQYEPLLHWVKVISINSHRKITCRVYKMMERVGWAVLKYISHDVFYCKDLKRELEVYFYITF